MKSIIVGTAGHIDHGKTAVVKALTGIDADRLQEEKRRGITIDLGFAHLELLGPDSEPIRLGFIDVPGHERFVRNMLAGVGGIDLVLFVIAADESIKPQTREHFDICRLLGVRHGITVLTKSDLVDSETLNVVKFEVEEFLRGSFLDVSRSPIVPLSSLTGSGLDDLKRELVNTATQVVPKDPQALARLPIDRVFTMKGFGTVVTGTLVAGSVLKEDELEVLPGGQRVRVRGVQVHDAPVEQAVAGQRTALNLAGATTEQLARGMTLVPPDTFHCTSRVDVRLSLLASAKPLKHGARVHFHAYTMETVAKVRLYGMKELKAGDEQYAQLRLAEPQLLLTGDRFILRQFSPVVTIGGGFVLEAVPSSRKLPNSEVAAFLTTLTTGSPQQILEARVKRRGLAGLRLHDVPGEMNIPLEQATGLAKSAAVVWCGKTLVAAPLFATGRAAVRQSVEKFHASNPLVPGIGKEELRERTRIGPEVFQSVFSMMVENRELAVAGELVCLPGRGVVLKDEETEAKRVVETTFATAGLTVPALKDVLAALKVDKARAQKIITLLLRDKILIKVSDDLIFHRSALEDLRRRLLSEKAKSAKIDVARFKDLTGVSRKYAIPLLEYLDREHVTRRVGDERVIL